MLIFHSNQARDPAHLLVLGVLGLAIQLSSLLYAIAGSKQLKEYQLAWSLLNFPVSNFKLLKQII